MALNPTPTMDLVINDLSEAAALAEAEKWWSIMNGGLVADTLGSTHVSPNVLAHPKYVAAAGGVDAHFLFEASANPVEVAGAYSVKDAVGGKPGYGMDDDLSPAAGTLVNCWDPNPTKRGRYQKVGASGTGSWTRVATDPQDKLWSDYNHPERLLELLVCSFAKSSAPLGFMGTQQGWDGPDDHDWRGGRITLDVSLEQARAGPWSKFGLHCQGNLADRAAALTALYGEGTKYFLPNFIQTRQLLSDQLDFGTDSWGLPNDVPVVRAANRRQIVVDLTPDDVDWECFGDPGRDPTGRSINYGNGPVGEVLANLQGNIYLLWHHLALKTGGEYWDKSSSETVPNFDRFSGKLRLFGAKIEEAA